MPVVPILLAIGGLTSAVSLFATWFDVTAVSFSGFEPPTRATVERVRRAYDQTGWEFWDGADVGYAALGGGLLAVAVVDAVRRRMPWPVLAVAGALCVAGAVVLLAQGFEGDAVALPEGVLGERAGEGRITRERAGGQWVALVGLAVSLAAMALSWRDRRGAGG